MFLVALTLLWLAMTCFYTWQVVALWRNPMKIEFFVASLSPLPLGEAGRRGEVRAAPLTCTTLWAIGSALVGILISDYFPGLSFLNSTLVGVLTIGAILVPLVLEVLVVLVNRPRFVVPPHMRGDRGVLIDRIHRRRERRK
ncbi:hypothetical protein GCM10007368_40160 [Isoptericola cucumis]|uniref:Uncharacterized protein n=1 Tax=Isoptericola cucumis TaxID=1776856 RepID=A0ABQ2BB18_9MICO|nr:hypothetical protein GCM10007368_40160 [Isoptericola cucumis]